MLVRGLVLAVLFCTLCRGAFIAYDYPVSIGNQSVYNGSLGMDFDVNTTITITSLGVYDSGADGLGRQITAYIYNRNTATAVATLVFDIGNTGTLVNGQRFLTLTTPLVLTVGFQGSIVAENYGDLEPNMNNVPGSLSTLNDGGGAISFVGTARYGDLGSFPGNPDFGPVNRYGAGTFIFEPADTTIPEPSTGLLLAAGLLGLAWMRRRV